MLYLVINRNNMIVGRFLSKERAQDYQKERGDNSIIKEITKEEYEEMRKKFFKNT